MTSSWRNPPSPTRPTQIAAVNELLQSIGQAPVSTLDTSNPDVSIAWNTLVSTSRDVQAEGWTFNKEDHIQLNRSTEAATLNYLLVADNELQVELAHDDFSNAGHNAVLRAGTLGGSFRRWLYDKETHSNTWDYNPIVNKMYYFDWENVPLPVQQYIIARACTICSSRIVGDSSQYQYLKQREDYCRAQAIEYETSQGDYNYLGTDDVENLYIPFQPFHALRRF